MTDIRKYYDNVKTKKRFWIGGFIIIVVLGLLMFSSYGVIKSIKLASTRLEKLDELKELKMENDSLRKKIIQLKTDTLEIEKVAREKYGMIKPGEKIYIKQKTSDDQ